MSAKRKPRRASRRPAASQSFNVEEVAWLAQLMETLLRGGDTRTLIRSPHAAKVHQKVQTMRNRIEQLKKEKANGG